MNNNDPKFEEQFDHLMDRLRQSTHACTSPFDEYLVEHKLGKMSLPFKKSIERELHQLLDEKVRTIHPDPSRAREEGKYGHKYKKWLDPNRRQNNRFT